MSSIVIKILPISTNTTKKLLAIYITIQEYFSYSITIINSVFIISYIGIITNTSV